MTPVGPLQVEMKKKAFSSWLDQIQSPGLPARSCDTQSGVGTKLFFKG